MNTITWKRFGGYEVSTKGDRRFSAFCAYLPDGRSIEEHYQCDIKGYDPGGRNWRLGKGRPPKVLRDTYPEYLALWRQWADNHPALMADLRVAAERNGCCLSDRFASSPVNQARALADLLNNAR
jgi:hypothetical protein